MDKDHAIQVDRHLAQARRELAAYLMAWRRRCALSQREVEALSRAASGRKRITCDVMNKLRLMLESEYKWHPQSSLLVGLDELQQLLLAWEERGEWPARLNPDLQTRVQPFRRLDGRPMGRLDWYAALIGEPGIIGASAHDPAHVERLQRLAIVLGEQIEQAMVGSGLRPIRDIDVFLSNYPDHDGRPFLRQVVLGDALFSPDKLHLCLPAIAFALRETTGDQSWSVDRLLDIVNGGSAGAKASPL